ncbi:hypothetical protein FNF31_05635 [Cafeteria roenbergensis]|uniref:MSP domain-containing protein n=1 Tax=Cafeteria roenbergensis TaxID=33653 RepID=A0A5A8CZR5_CAFRO|nr:hypothetical protein FNF28_06657 [Cafeteria roenbergensis]KAA0157907.1 hypothetical protein FNF31_05635 [Cafeteria roenbergensis]
MDRASLLSGHGAPGSSDRRGSSASVKSGSTLRRGSLFAFDTEDTLQFRRWRDESGVTGLRAMLKARNRAETHVAFKCKTNNRERYRVEPNRFLVKGGLETTITITVSSDAAKAIIAKMAASGTTEWRSQDRFRLQLLALSEGFATRVVDLSPSSFSRALASAWETAEARAPGPAGPSPITEDGSPAPRAHAAGGAGGAAGMDEEDGPVDVTAAADAEQEQEDDAALMRLFSEQPAADDWEAEGRGVEGDRGGGRGGRGGGGGGVGMGGGGGGGMQSDSRPLPGYSAGGQGYGRGRRDSSDRRAPDQHVVADVDEEGPGRRRYRDQRSTPGHELHPEVDEDEDEEAEQDEDAVADAEAEAEAEAEDDAAFQFGFGRPSPMQISRDSRQPYPQSAADPPAKWGSRGASAQRSSASTGQSPAPPGATAGRNPPLSSSPALEAALRTAQRETADAEARAEEAASEVEATLAELARVRAELAAARAQAAAAEGRAKAAEEAALAGTRRRAAGKREGADDGSADASASAALSGKSDASLGDAAKASGGHTTACVVVVGVVVFWAGALLQAFLSGDIAM